MLYKLLKKSRVYELLTLLLISSMTAISAPVNAQERACVISDSGKKVCGKLIGSGSENQSSTPSQPTATVKFSNMNVDVKLLKCSRKTSTVNCKFSATTEDSTNINLMYFYAAYGTKVSQITDDKGEDYIASKVTLGKSETREFLFTPLVKDQPVSVTLSFKIPPNVNSIKTLSFLTGEMHFERAAIFTNINISR